MRGALATKSAMVAGHTQGQKSGGTNPRYLRTRHIEVDETFVVHGLSSVASRAFDHIFVQRSAVELLCTI